MPSSTRSVCLLTPSSAKQAATTSVCPALPSTSRIARQRVERAAQALAERRYDVGDQLAGRARAVLSQPVLAGVEAPSGRGTASGDAPPARRSSPAPARTRPGGARASSSAPRLAPRRGSPSGTRSARRCRRELMILSKAASGRRRNGSARALRGVPRSDLAQAYGADPSPETQTCTRRSCGVCRSSPHLHLLRASGVARIDHDAGLGAHTSVCRRSSRSRLTASSAVTPSSQRLLAKLIEHPCG